MHSVALLPLLAIAVQAAPSSSPEPRQTGGHSSISSWTGPPNGPGIEEITQNWPRVPFKLLGGFSPWFDADGVYGIQRDSMPEECKVDQVQIYMRHNMREASGGTNRGLTALAKKLHTTNFTVTDPKLDFLKSWDWTQPAELLTPLGTASAYANGMAFYRRYSDLLPENAYFNWTGTGAPTIPVRSTDQQRVNATAEAFARGMLGEDMPARTKWLVTPDSITTFNSTLASNNCPAVNTINSQANSIFNADFQRKIVKRLSAKMPGFNLSTSDVAAMMNACPFDSFALQQPSPFCSIFSEHEWKGYNYAIDLTQFDNAGYGGPIGSAWGVGWVAEMIARLNNSAVVSVGSVNTTLDSDPKTFPLDAPIMLDFGHDSGLESIITAMQLLPAKYDGSVTVNDIDANRAWQSALIAPMGGRLEVERLQCTGGKFSGKYIRFVLNNAVVPLEPLAACKSDKNAAAVGICKLDTFIGTQSKALSGADFGNCAKNYTGVAL